jgi:hypothetical protein
VWCVGCSSYTAFPVLPFVDANVPVVLTGDVHRNWANDLKVDYKDPASPVVGSELVCTSITSTGKFSDESAPALTWLPAERCGAARRFAPHGSVEVGCCRAAFAGTA